MGQPNQRRFPRQAARIEADVKLDWGALHGIIENIGEGGLFFVTDTLEGAIVEGDRVETRFRDGDGGSEVRLPGQVLRVERYFHDGEVLRALAIRFDRPYRAVSRSSSS